MLPFPLCFPSPFPSLPLSFPPIPSPSTGLAIEYWTEHDPTNLEVVGPNAETPLAVDPVAHTVFEHATQQQLRVRSICVRVQGYAALRCVMVSKVGRYAYRVVPETEDGVVADQPMLVVEVTMQVVCFWVGGEGVFVSVCVTVQVLYTGVVLSLLLSSSSSLFLPHTATYCHIHRSCPPHTHNPSPIHHRVSQSLSLYAVT